jgi:hypothetical protein
VGSSDKPWKVFERIAARFFGGDRIVPSDTRSQGDVLHDFLYVECKAYLKQVPAVVTLFNKTEDRAKKEKKVPVVCLKRKGTSGGFLVVCSADDLEKVYLAWKEGEDDDSRRN